MVANRYTDKKTIIKNVRELRKNSTKSELQLWEYLRNRRLEGYKFLRQHPIIYRAYYKGYNYFVADFYCGAKKAVIELDGSIHNETEEYDQFRDDEMKQLGLHVLRLRNDELSNMEDTLLKIKTFLSSIS